MPANDGLPRSGKLYGCNADVCASFGNSCQIPHFEHMKPVTLNATDEDLSTLKTSHIAPSNAAKWPFRNGLSGLALNADRMTSSEVPAICASK